MMGYKNVYVCDQCGEEAPGGGGLFTTPSPPGWWVLYQTSAPDTSAPPSVIFCTKDCLANWMGEVAA